MSFPVKPKQIYSTDTKPTSENWYDGFEQMFGNVTPEEKEKELLKDEVVEEPIIEQKEVRTEFTYEEKLQILKRLSEELNIEYSIKVTPSIPVNEIVPEITPVVEEVIPEVTPTLEEVVLKFTPTVEEKVPEVTPTIEEPKTPTVTETEKKINFNYERPDGWNKRKRKTSFLKVFWDGLLDKNMEVSDLRRYDNFMSNFKPIFIIFLILVGIVVFLLVSGATSEKYAKGKDSSYMDRVINFCIEKYDNITGNNVTTNHQVKEIKTENIFENPKKIDTFVNKVDTLLPVVNNWESQYNQIDTLK